MVVVFSRPGWEFCWRFCSTAGGIRTASYEACTTWPSWGFATRPVGVAESLLGCATVPFLALPFVVGIVRPGRMCRACSLTTTLPSSDRNRAIRLICFCGPPTLSQGIHTL